MNKENLNFFKEKRVGDEAIQREGLHNTEPKGTGSMMVAKIYLGQ